MKEYKSKFELLTDEQKREFLHKPISELKEIHSISRRTAQYWRKKIKEEFGQTTPVFPAVKLKNKVSIINRKLADTEAELLKANTELELLKQIPEHILQSPNEVYDFNTDNIVYMTALSDIHYGEYVSEEEIHYVNKYDSDIADRRLYMYFHKLSTIVNNNQKIYPSEHLVLALLGDFLSGNIHQELRETNDLPVMEAMLRLESVLINGFKYLLENTNVSIFVPCVKGNHSRLGEKRFKQKAYENYEHVIYHHLARYFENEERIKFKIASGDELFLRVNNITYLFEHGDNYRSQNTVKRDIKHKRELYASTGIQTVSTRKITFDKVVMGHFHNVTINNDYLIMGSVVGPNEYSTGLNLGFEPPQMLFWLNDSVNNEFQYTNIPLTSPAKKQLKGVTVF